MAEDNTNGQTSQQLPTPNADLKSLEPLVGTWKMSGDTKGTLTYAWMEGGFFLIQQFDFELHDHRVKGMEIIGHFQPFGETPSEMIKSRAYDSIGNTLDYVYELTGNILMIWGGEKGSPAYFKGTFSDDHNTCAGEWVYPGGGGYASTMIRIK